MRYTPGILSENTQLASRIARDKRQPLVIFDFDDLDTMLVQPYPELPFIENERLSPLSTIRGEVADGCATVPGRWLVSGFFGLAPYNSLVVRKQVIDAYESAERDGVVSGIAKSVSPRGEEYLVLFRFQPDSASVKDTDFGDNSPVKGNC